MMVKVKKVKSKESKLLVFSYKTVNADYISKSTSHYFQTMSNSKKIQEMEDRIRELEELISRKEFEIEFKSKMIDIAEEMYGIDIRKK